LLHLDLTYALLTNCGVHEARTRAATLHELLKVVWQRLDEQAVPAEAALKQQRVGVESAIQRTKLHKRTWSTNSYSPEKHGK